MPQHSRKMQDLPISELPKTVTVTIDPVSIAAWVAFYEDLNQFRDGNLIEKCIEIIRQHYTSRTSSVRKKVATMIAEVIPGLSNLSALLKLHDLDYIIWHIFESSIEHASKD